jgi:hypothetical protein
MPLAFLRLAAAAALLIICGAAQAQWSGHLGFATNNLNRGRSESDQKPAFDAGITWRHGSGVHAAVGIVTVSDRQYVGSDGYKLTPAVGWSRLLGSEEAWCVGVNLRGQVFPGASGTFTGNLPPRLQSRLQARAGDYGTLEAGASIGYRAVTLSVARALTNYLGLEAEETGPLGTRLLESQGTTYVGLDVQWPLNDTFTFSVGAGRLLVPNFDGLDYTDWRLGMTAFAAGLAWSLEAAGNDARQGVWSARQGDDEKSATVRVSVRRAF